MPPIFMRQGLNPLLGLFLAFVLTACATLHDAGQEPVKSANDDYQYRLLTLPNEMEVQIGRASCRERV